MKMTTAQSFWENIKAATMSGRDSSPKISLAMLKGRPAAQSVPSISFRFNPSADNVTQVSDTEDDEEDLSSEISIGPTLEVGSAGQVARAESLREASPIKEHGGRSLGKRSSSLDNCGSLAEPATTSTTPSKPQESGSLLSRLTKTFEDKINEIRNDKKEKEFRQEKEKEKEKEKDRLAIAGDGSTESDGGSVSEDRSPTSKDKKLIDIVQKTVEAEKGLKTDITGSPPKTKTSIVQDISEHTSKLKSELGSIRPKISELRHRRSSKENAKNSKESTKTNKPFVFTSLLGRDEGMDEEMLHECDESEVDKAVEAHEDPCIFDEDMAEVDGDVPVSEKVGDRTNLDSTHKTSRSPKKRAPTLIPEGLTELTLKEQFLNMVNVLPISMGLLTKVSIGLFIICFILPLPRFLAGLVLGVNVAGIVFYCLLHFLIPAPPVLPLVDDGPVLLTLPTYEDKQLHKGWMNELQGEYSPDSYHVSHTHSVMVRLQGSCMQIDNLRGKVPKHARLKEEVRNLAFTHHREYDIAGCDVMLFPRNLPRRWLWSRKYPICIRLQNGSRGSTPSPVSIASSTPTGSAQGSPTHFSVPGLGRQGSSESGEGNWSLDNNKSSGEDDLLTSSLDMASFEEVTQDMCQEKSLYLFARTDREKDDWFRRLVAASELAVKPQSSPSHKPLPPDEDTILLEGINDPFSDTSRDSQQQDMYSATPPDLSFERYMARLLYQPGGMTSDGTPGPANVAWINALAGRLFYDFLRNPYWANKVQERVQRKLSKLHVPYFVGEVVVCGVNMGSSTPQLNAVGTPHVDPRGLWVDLNVEYSGNFTMSLETKLDLMKLKRTAGIGGNTPNTSSPPSPAEPAAPHSVPRVYTRSPSSDHLLRNLHFETDTDDSVESSSEEECDEEGIAAEAGLPVGGSGPTSRRLLRLVDTVAASRYFQHAAESRLLQRALQGVSNTRIELSVEVRKLAGTLALNVPPPPADRLWYGFRGVPELVMVARPRLGDRTLNLPILVEFIQKQLRLIFEKVFVLPNMDDIVIPIMSPLLPGQHQQPRPPWEPSHRPPSESPVPITITSCSSSTLSTPSVKFTPSPH